MSTTTEIAIINDPMFGQLVELPNILNQNKTSALNCVTACRSVIDTIKEMDISTLTPEQLKMHSDKIAQYRAKTAKTLETMNERRSPYTKFFDSVKSLFTTEEKSVSGVLDEMKSCDDNMQRAIANHNKLEQDRQAAIIAKNTEGIDIIKYINANLVNNVRAHAATLTSRMMNKFYSLTSGAQIDEFVKTITNYQPAIDDATWNALCKNGDATYKYHTPDEVAAIYTSTCTAMRNEYCETAISIVSDCKNKILNDAESRKAELIRIATDANAKLEADARIKQEQADREASQKRDAADAAARLDAQAEADKTNKVFDVMSESTPVHSIASGTVVKKKYVPASHAAFMAIMQSWITHDMPALTIEELETKLKFMLTAANKRLNTTGEKLEAKGLTVEEDFSTRTRRTA